MTTPADVLNAIFDNPLIGLAFIGIVMFVAWLAWRTEMKPLPPPDGDHWERPKPWPTDQPPEQRP